MSCDRFAQVHAYHDDAMTPAERVALEAHLEACRDCRDLLADLRGLSRLVASAPLAPVSPAAMARLGNSWRSARDRGVLRITSWLTAAAAGVLVGALWFWPEPGGAGPTHVAQSSAWETVALMPPPEAQDENVPELIVLAQWMANDLAAGERQ